MTEEEIIKEFVEIYDQILSLCVRLSELDALRESKFQGNMKYHDYSRLTLKDYGDSKEDKFVNKMEQPFRLAHLYSTKETYNSPQAICFTGVPGDYNHSWIVNVIDSDESVVRYNKLIDSGFNFGYDAKKVDPKEYKRENHD